MLVSIKVSFDAQELRDALPKVHFELINRIDVDLMGRADPLEEILHNRFVLEVQLFKRALLYQC